MCTNPLPRRVQHAGGFAGIRKDLLFCYDGNVCSIAGILPSVVSTWPDHVGVIAE